MNLWNTFVVILSENKNFTWLFRKNFKGYLYISIKSILLIFNKLFYFLKFSTKKQKMKNKNEEQNYLMSYCNL